MTARILHVIRAMDRGGAETMIMNLYRIIDRKRFQFDFLVHEQRACDYDDEIRSLGGKIYYVPLFTGFNGRTYRRACRDFYADHPEHVIIHGHIGSSAALYLGEANKLGRITIAHSHSSNFPLSFGELLFRLSSLPTRRTANWFLACSREAGIDRFGSKVVEGDHFRILKNAIDVAAYECTAEAHVRAQEKVGLSGSLVVGHVGRLVDVKNHTFLLNVFSRLLMRCPQAILVLVGRGPLEERLKQQAHSLGIAEHVVFLGVRDDVPTLMKAFDLFLFPSLSEGMPVATIEAQATGLPTILSTGVPDLAVATSRTERLPLVAGEDAWADRALTLLRKPYDRAQGAREVRAAGFDISTTASWLSEFYADLLA